MDSWPDKFLEDEAGKTCFLDLNQIELLIKYHEYLKDNDWDQKPFRRPENSKYRDDMIRLEHSRKELLQELQDTQDELGDLKKCVEKAILHLRGQ